MKDDLLGILRDPEKGSAAFRKAADKLARVLVGEMEDMLHRRGVSGEEVMVVPVLRSGVVFLYPFMDNFKGAPVCFFGIKRNKKTSEAKLYYKNIPKPVLPVAVIADPMLATGGSVSVAVDELFKKGVGKDKIYFLGMIASQDGFNKLARLIPRENIILAVIDPKLDSRKNIVPGFGDFGDRYFGTI